MHLLNADQPTAGNAEMDARTASLEVQHAADQATIIDLEAAGIVDHDRIADLESVGDIDRAVIAQLEADGVLDRAKIANLDVALATCRCIGAAIGIIMAVHKVTQEQAFAVLRDASQLTNRKLRDVADDVLTTGTTPTGCVPLRPRGVGERTSGEVTMAQRARG